MNSKKILASPTTRGVTPKLRAALWMAFLLTSPGVAGACDRPEGIPDAKVTLVGEIHGTNEAPELFYRLACATAARSQGVVVALELPRSLQAPIDSFMASEGREVDRERLLSVGFWSRARQDGRSSIAMITLIDRLRALRRAGFDVQVLAIDEQIEGSRDAGMALHISRSVETSAYPLVGLMGNYHARKTRGVSWDDEYEPAGYRLLRYSPLNVLVAQTSGSAWVCAPDCGVHRVGDHRFKDQELGYGQDATGSGYDGAYLIPATTASFPAAAFNSGR